VISVRRRELEFQVLTQRAECLQRKFVDLNFAKARASAASE